MIDLYRYLTVIALKQGIVFTTLVIGFMLVNCLNFRFNAKVLPLRSLIESN